MKMKKTGIVELEGDLNNKDLWMYVVNGIVPSIRDKAWFPLANSNQKGRVSLVIENIVPRGKLPIRFGYDRDVMNLLYQEQQAQIAAVNDAFVNVFQGIIQQSWLLLGEIRTKSGEDISLLILYSEAFDRLWYSIIKVDQKRTIEQYVARLN